MSETIIEMYCPDCRNKFWLEMGMATMFEGQTIICPFRDIGKKCYEIPYPTGAELETDSIREAT